MNLGTFSVSLVVKNLQASKSFYEKLGFTEFGGNANEHWLILKNGEHTIGLFQGMFEENIMTFNPGWNSNAEPLDNYTDVRELQQQLKNDGVEFITEADPDSSGPASCMITDPDGNTILLDQHV